MSIPALGIDLTSAVASGSSKVTFSQTGSITYTLQLNASAVSELFVNGSASSNVMFAVAIPATSTDTSHFISAVAVSGQQGFQAGNVSSGSISSYGGSVDSKYSTFDDDSNSQTGLTSSTNPSLLTWAQLISGEDGKTLSGMALTMSYTNGSESAMYLTMRFDDGSVTELYGFSTGLKWTQGQKQYSSVDVNTSYVDQVYVFNSAMTKDDALSLNSQALAAAVPEPATATLSLLALAGLAARRRRK